ncbi:MAG: ATP-binding cassette domain-containing protein [Treponema sp.]|jgi:zinc transport system ATP-binding protein|nr:ATP-binding cassette domain-containing protein [Treponema sp.]
MNTVTGSAVRCEDAVFGYDGRAAVGGLDFTINQGDYLCVVGENGSGKSTLAKGILRLVPPMRGTITFGAALGKGDTGCLSQGTAVKKDFPAGVYEIVLSGNSGGMGLRPFYSAREKQRAEENMERLGVADLRRRCFRELSGGQQRRVLIARALCAARKMLVLDEPAAGLDPLVTSGLYDLLEKINRDMGITIVMISHDIEAALKYARFVLHLEKENGQGINAQRFFGSPAEYIKSNTGRELYVHRAG